MRDSLLSQVVGDARAHRGTQIKSCQLSLIDDALASLRGQDATVWVSGTVLAEGLGTVQKIRDYGLSFTRTSAETRTWLDETIPKPIEATQEIKVMKKLKVTVTWGGTSLTEMNEDQLLDAVIYTQQAAKDLAEAAKISSKAKAKMAEMATASTTLAAELDSRE